MAHQLRPTVRELEDTFWRSLWTFIAAALGFPVADAVLGLDAGLGKAMLAAGIIAVANVLLAFARHKLGGVNAPGT